jgi:hypothetical protein
MTFPIATKFTFHFAMFAGTAIIRRTAWTGLASIPFGYGMM